MLFKRTETVAQRMTAILLPHRYERELSEFFNGLVAGLAG
jgi:hypothetical protein